jgi:Short C-terminal domain
MPGLGGFFLLLAVFFGIAAVYPKFLYLEGGPDPWAFTSVFLALLFGLMGLAFAGVGGLLHWGLRDEGNRPPRRPWQWALLAVGLAVTVVGLSLFFYGLHSVYRVGSCASGGPYESRQECPGEAILMFPGVLVMLVGWGMFTIGLARHRGRMRLSGGLGSASQVLQRFRRPEAASAIPRFVPAAPTTPPSPPPPAAPPFTATPEPPRPPPGPDPLDRLEKLAELRDSGVLTEAEFQVQKAKLLAET